MNSLQSKDMPLRTLDRFYQPFYKEKSSEGLKIFPEKHIDTKNTVLTPKGELPSVTKYLSGLNEAKVLPRKIANKYEYYPLVRSCRRHRNKSAFKDDFRIENVEEMLDNKSRLQTLVSSHPSNRSIMVFSHISGQQKKIASQKQRFRQTRSLRKEEKQKEMRFSFYNTIQKSDHFLRKFKEDSFMEERKTNNYQNVFKRTITTENIFTILKKANQKYKMGL